MLAWLAENLGTIIVSLILIAVVSLIVVKMIKDKKSGKGSCGCEHCAMHGKCHNK